MGTKLEFEVDEEGVVDMMGQIMKRSEG